jgi:alpha-tubulin suppressor-like RCC1 family protein
MDGMKVPSARLTIMLLLPLLGACGGDGSGPAGAGPWAQVAAGDQFTCGLTTTGEAWCWGAGLFGQLGNNATTSQSSPVRVAGGHVFRSIAVGSDHVCAIAPDQTAWCWGLNDFSELGASTIACSPSLPFARCARIPVHVTGAPSFASVVVAGYASCGLTPGGEAYCWGWSDHGQTGSGAVLDIIDHPARVTGGPRFLALSLDIYHACGRTTSSSLFCWGSNDHGELAADNAATVACGSGIGAFPCAPSPVEAASGLSVASVSAGSAHTCALTTADGLWCWGSNQDGALGNPTTLGGPAPVKVAGGVAFTAVDAGEDHTCALGPDGSPWCWGLNTYGQLGVGVVNEVCPAFGSARPCHTSPGLVQVPVSLVSISAGSGHTCGVSADGEIWCWGRGTAGQLGDGRGVDSDALVKVLHP